MHTETRSFKEEDRDEVNKIFKEDGLDKRLRADLISADSKCISLVFEVEYTEIVGFGALSTYFSPTMGYVGKIEDLIIKKSQRGNIYGKLLLEDMILIAKERGLLNLTLSSNSELIAARDFYLEKGFTLLETGVFLWNLK